MAKHPISHHSSSAAVEEPPVQPEEPAQQAEVTPLVTPPIQLRNTYPPGNPPLGRAPQPLARTPQSLTDIETPGSILGTRHQGPLLSGPTPGVQGATGSAPLALCLQIDGSMGNFNVPIQFPGGSFLKSIDAITYAAGIPGTVVITLGTTSGASDIATVVLPALNAVEPTVFPSVQLPLWNAATPFLMWLNVSANTASAGGGVIIVNYIRLTGPWSGPAK